MPRDDRRRDPPRRHVLPRATTRSARKQVMSDDGAAGPASNSGTGRSEIAIQLTRHRQAIPRRGRQRWRRPHRAPGHRARDRRRERCRQVDADEDALRRAQARRGHDHRQRRDQVFSSPKDAIAEGIGMVFQAFMLAANLTVWENIVLGDEPGSAFSLDIKQARSRIIELGEQYGLDVDPDAADLRPRRRREAARRDPQGALPRRQDPDPRRADRRARAPRGRRTVRLAARADRRRAPRSSSSPTSSTRSSSTPMRSR